MKKLHNLLWSVAIVTGLMVQSCSMDYNEPEGVTALREATAELISAQAAVEMAEVAIKEATAAQAEAIAAGYLIDNQIKEITLAKAEIELAMDELELQEAEIDLAIYELKLAEATATSEVTLAELEVKLLEQQISLANKQFEYDNLESTQAALLLEYETAMLNAQSGLLSAQITYETALNNLATTLNGIETEQLNTLDNIITSITTNRTKYYAAVDDLITLNLNYLKLSDYTYDSTSYEATLQASINSQAYTVAGIQNLITNYQTYNGVSSVDTSALSTLSTSLAALVKEYNTNFESYKALTALIDAAVIEEAALETANLAAEKVLSTANTEAETALSTANTKAETELSESQTEAVTALTESQTEAVETLTKTQTTARIATYTEAVTDTFKVTSTDTDVIKSLVSGLETNGISTTDLTTYGVVYVTDTPAASGLSNVTIPTSTFTITSEAKVTTDDINSANITSQKNKVYNFNKAVRDFYVTTIGQTSSSITDEALAEAYTKFIATDHVATAESIAQLAIYKTNYETALATFTAAETAFKTAYEPYKWGEQTMYQWITAQVTAYQTAYNERSAYITEAMQQQLAADLITYAKARVAVDGFAAVRTIAAVAPSTTPTYTYWYESLGVTGGWQSLFVTTPAVYDNTDPQNPVLVTAAALTTEIDYTVYNTILGSSALENSKYTGPEDTTDGVFTATNANDKSYSEYAYGAYYWAYYDLYGGYIQTTNNVVTYATTYTFEEVCKTPSLLTNIGTFYTYVTAYNAMQTATDQATVNLAKELNSLYALTSPAYVAILAKYDALVATKETDAKALAALKETNTEAMTTLTEANAEALAALVKTNTAALTALQKTNATALTTLQETNAAALTAMKNDTTVGSEGSVVLEASRTLLEVLVGTPTVEIYTEMLSATATNDLYSIKLSSSISGGTLCVEINQLISIYNTIVTTANAVNYDYEILEQQAALATAQVALAKLEDDLAFVQAGGYYNGSTYLATQIAVAESNIALKEAEIATLEEEYALLLAQKSAFLSSIE